jgi:hypothetical protein
MPITIIHTVLRLVAIAVMMMAVVPSPSGWSAHTVPAAAANEQPLFQIADDPVEHGRVHDDVDATAGAIAGPHGHAAVDHAHDTSVLPGGITSLRAALCPRWPPLPRAVARNDASARLDRPPRGDAAT